MKWAAAILGRGRRQDGQALVIVVLFMFVLFGFAALVVDVGRQFLAQQQLQGAVNAAALAGGRYLPNAGTAYSEALTYGGATGEKNAIGGFGVSAGSPTVTFECVSHAPFYTAGSPPTCLTDTSNSHCQPTGAQAPQPSGATTCNAVHVTETATVKTSFGFVALPSWTISSSATAAVGGDDASPANVYVILDNTKSMEDDACDDPLTGNGNPGVVTTVNATPTNLDCAKSGMRALLDSLWPCNSESSCPGLTPNGTGSPTSELGANVTSPEDEVGILVIPAIGTGTAAPGASTLAEEADCTAGDTFTDSYPPWSDPTTPSILDNDAYIGYQAVGLSSDYRPYGGTSTAATTLNWTAAESSTGAASNIVQAVDWGQCPGSGYPTTKNSGGYYDYYGLKDIGGRGSYLAGAITEAEYLLQENARADTASDIVIESDGGMTEPTKFSNGTQSDTPCEDAVQAAAAAKAAGDTIYTIEYDSTDGPGCGPDVPADSYDNADTFMEDMASNTSDWFDDPTPSGIVEAFEQVGSQIGDSREIPDCTVPPPGC